MRTRIGLLGGALIVLIGAGVAALAYQAGLSQSAAATTSGGPVVYYGGWGWGFFPFHIIGLLFGLIFLFIVARIVIGVLFWRGPRRWEERWGPGGPGGPGGPWGRHGYRAARFEEMHRWMHEQEAARNSQPGSQDAPNQNPPAPPSGGQA